jgi:hypothetical protein
MNNLNKEVFLKEFNPNLQHKLFKKKISEMK